MTESEYEKARDGEIDKFIEHANSGMASTADGFEHMSDWSRTYTKAEYEAKIKEAEAIGWKKRDEALCKAIFDCDSVPKDSFEMMLKAYTRGFAHSESIGFDKAVEALKRKDGEYNYGLCGEHIYSFLQSNKESILRGDK